MSSGVLRGLVEASGVGKDQKRVKKLIAGPSVYICDGCTGLAKVVISDGQPVTTTIAELTTRLATWSRRLPQKLHCALGSSSGPAVSSATWVFAG